MQWLAGLWASVFGSSPNTCAHHACNWCMVVFGTSRAAFKRLCNWWGSKVHATPRLNCPHNHTWGWFWPVHPMHVCSAHTWWPLPVHAMPFPTLDLAPRLIGQIWKCHWASKAEWWKNAGQLMHLCHAVGVAPLLGGFVRGAIATPFWLGANGRVWHASCGCSTCPQRNLNLDSNDSNSTVSLHLHLLSPCRVVRFSSTFCGNGQNTLFSSHGSELAPGGASV